MKRFEPRLGTTLQTSGCSMRQRLLLVGLALVLAGCSSGAQPQTAVVVVQPGEKESRSLVMVIRGEPVSLASKPVRASGLGVRPATRLFNAELDLADGANSPRPYLIEALPQLNTNSWQVFPDGRMETAYRLRAGLTWHDGAALSAQDFAFAWRVYLTPEFGQSASTPINQMEEVRARDERTVLIRWKGPYPEASFLQDTFQALPRHLLEQSFQQGDLEGFVNHPYWSSEYVGLGPYRLERWEPGALIEGSAFEGHALGRPRIERVVVRFISDENVVLTNVLSEQVHFTAGQTLRYEQAKVLTREWATNPKGVVIQIPIQLRFIHVQLRPDLVAPRALLDLRARRALAHSLDRQAIDEGLYDGQGVVTETFLARKAVPYWAEVDRATVKYPYELSRAEELMGEVGFRRGSDSVYVNAQGERFAPELWGDAGTGFERELAIVSDGWRQAGLDTSLNIVPVAQFRNGELRNSFRGLYSSAGPGGIERSMNMMTTGNIGSARNGWTGSNRGGWSNPEYDQLWGAFNTTLDRPQRIQQLIRMEQLIAEQLPMIMLLHNPYIVTHATSLRGPDPNATQDLTVWNIHEWEWNLS